MKNKFYNLIRSSLALTVLMMIGMSSVFAQGVTTTLITDNAQATIHAGSSLDFVATFSDPTDNFEDAVFSLMVNFGGDDWILATSTTVVEGDGTAPDSVFFSNVEIPSVIWTAGGSIIFRTRVSSRPVGAVGELANPASSFQLSSNDDWVSFGNGMSYNVFRFFQGLGTTRNFVFEGSTGRRQVTTRDLDTREIISFDFQLALESLDSTIITANQFVQFEYSTNGGSSWTSLAQFPNDSVVNNANNTGISFDLPAAARTESTRFRWRQEEARGTVMGTNVRINVTPDYIPTSFPNDLLLPIRPQAINVVSEAERAHCSGDEITLNFDYNGRFSDEVVFDLQWRRQSNGNTGTIAPENLSIEKNGNQGTVTFTLPAFNFGNQGFDDLRFRLRAEDFFADLSANVTGNYNDQPLRIVESVRLPNSFELNPGLICEDDFPTISISNNVQNGFTYVVRDANDASAEFARETAEGTATLTIELPLDIPFGTRLEVMVMAPGLTTEDGESCGMGVIDQVARFERNPFELALVNFNVFPNLIESIEGEIVVGRNQNFPSRAVSFTNDGQVFRFIENGNIFSEGYNFFFGSVTEQWYRNNLSNPVGRPYNTGFTQSGEYFVVITDQSGCEFTTNSITVRVVDAPGRPTITVEGETTFCTNEDVRATLTAPEGFEFYQWRRNGSNLSGNGSSRSIQVTSSGNYTVRVANDVNPADGQPIYSVESAVVTIETGDAVPIPGNPGSINSTTCGVDVAQVSYFGSNLNLYYVMVDAQTLEELGPRVQGSGTIILRTFAPVTENFDFRIKSDFINENACEPAFSVGSAEFRVRNIGLEVVGNRISIVSSTAGQRKIEWFRNGVLIRNQTGNNSIRVFDDATYSVEITFNDGCVLSSTATSGERVLSLGEDLSIDLKTYPNPAKSFTNLQIEDAFIGAVEVRIMDVSGRQVAVQQFEKSSIRFNEQVDLSSLRDGIYLMQVAVGAKSETLRIIKN
ncbi:MAG: T9SS type A sorting domain-containing protein [Cyclobacteriaceae bacterium]|nr:T9SS type A sorting domain-containing protein [Cyclobacteriaceae bacterium]MCH8516750.1 T9SS type A sorting domain-containing protein [Cyclobacteriaceae bacterium]